MQTGAYMATATKGLNKAEMKLLNDFANTVNAREFTEGVTISKMQMSYNADTGFEILLVEAPTAAPTSVVPEPESQPTV